MEYGKTAERLQQEFRSMRSEIEYLFSCHDCIASTEHSDTVYQTLTKFLVKKVSFSIQGLSADQNWVC